MQMENLELMWYLMSVLINLKMEELFFLKMTKKICQWINARWNFSIILKKVFHYWHFQVAPGLFIRMMQRTLNVFPYECTFNILYIKKALLQFHFIVIGKMGDGSQAGKWNVTIRGHCLYVISFRNCSASSSHRTNGNPGRWKAFHHPWGNLPDCPRLSRLERNVRKTEWRGWQA